MLPTSGRNWIEEEANPSKNIWEHSSRRASRRASFEKTWMPSF
jgi:hypothetical protein